MPGFLATKDSVGSVANCTYLCKRFIKIGIIDTAIKKHDELRRIKASLPTIISGRDLLSKK